MKGLIRNKNKLLILFTLLTTSVCLLTGSAFGLTVKFETRDYFAWARLYDGLGNPLNTNPFDGSVTQSLSPTGTYKGADGTEDSFGITAITRITDISGTTTIWQESASQELTAFFRGGDDVYLSSPDPFTGNSLLASTGFVIDLWLDTTPDYTPNAGTAGRTGVSSYTTATDGVLALALVGHTQFISGLPYTLLEDGVPSTGAFTGSILFDVVGGIWGPKYDTNTVTAPNDPSGNMADIKFTFATHALVPPFDPVADWLVGDTSSAIGTIVPEPSVMFLLGSGLLMIAAVRGRKFLKK